MSSKIKLNNNQGDTITLEHSDTISSLGSRVIPLDNITHKVSTIAELRAMTERPEFVYVEAYDDSGSTYGAFGSHFFKRSLVVVADNGGTVIQSVNDTYELQYSGAVNVKWFESIQDALNNKGRIYFPEGEYICSDTLTIYEDTVIVGANKNASRLSFTSGTGLCISLAPTVGTANIEIRDININNTAGERALIYMADLGEIKNITIDNCVLVNTVSLRSDVIAMYSEMSNVVIDNNTIYGNANPTFTPLETYYDQHLINIATSETDYDARKVIITNNELVDGLIGFATPGVNAPTTGITFSNNIVRGQKYRGAMFYHGRDIICTNNVFTDITARAGHNNDNAVLWLDCYGTGDNETTLVCTGNIIKHCTGNGIYTEEIQGGIISGNVIKNLSARTDDTYSFDWTYSTETHTYTSDGGHGILITGGTKNTVFDGNSVHNCDGNGIYSTRALGVHWDYDIIGLRLTDNSIYNNGKHGIVIEEVHQVSIDIDGNDIQGNGTSDTGGTPTNEYAGVIFIKQNTNSNFPFTKITNNTFGNGYYLYSNNQYYGIYKDTSGAQLLVSGNNIVTNGGEWIYNFSPSAMSIVNNMLYGNRGIYSSGSDYTIRGNLGYELEVMNATTVTGTATITHGLDDTPSGVNLTVHGGAGNFAQVNNITSTTFVINVFTSAGALETAARTVSFYAFKYLNRDS